MEQIEVTTEYTYPVYRKFNTFATFCRSAASKAMWIIIAVMAVLCVAMGVMSAVMEQDGMLLTYICVLVVIYVFLLVIFPIITYKGQIAGRGLIERSVFTEANITVTAQGSVGEMHQTFYWEALHSAYETKGFFYIFVARKQGVIVDKSKMQMTEIAALRAMIGNKLGDKFKLC